MRIGSTPCSSQRWLLLVHYGCWRVMECVCCLSLTCARQCCGRSFSAATQPADASTNATTNSCCIRRIFFGQPALRPAALSCAPCDT